MKILKTLFNITLKDIKYLQIKLTKDVYNLYRENYKTLRDFKEEINK
jgi:hypothetical protein